MTNLNQQTLDQLLERTQILNWLKAKRRNIDDFELSADGLNKVNDELSAIEAELDSRQPGVEFRELHLGINHSFSCRMGLDKHHTHCYSELVGFEPIYPFDFDILPDDYGLQPVA